MKPNQKDKKIDQIMTRLADVDKPTADFAKWQADHPQAIKTLTSRSGTDGKISSTPPRCIWRTIMKTKLTKIAAAAVIIIAFGIGFMLMTSPKIAYAIEQTIEAMRYIESIHAYCTDWDDSQGEVWVQLDPETGEEVRYYADQGNLLIVGTPQATYYYYKDKNHVRIRNKYVPASDVRFSRFFEDMVSFVNKYHGELSYHSEFDEDLQQKVIMVHCSIPEQENMQGQEYIIRVDPQTKLPISIEALKNTPGQGVKSIDRLEYNVIIPDGIFEFEIPEGATVIEQTE